MIDKYLPIGTVVLLKSAKKRLMITGFCAISEEKKDKMFDYSGVLYPEGVVSSEQTILFDHDQIDKIFSIGYIDEEEKYFKALFNEALKKKNVKSFSESIQNQIEELEMPKPIETLNTEEDNNSNPEVFNI